MAVAHLAASFLLSVVVELSSELAVSASHLHAILTLVVPRGELGRLRHLVVVRVVDGSAGGRLVVGVALLGSGAHLVLHAADADVLAKR